MPTVAQDSKRNKGRNGISCKACQKAKRKCDGKRPCSRCKRLGIDCCDGDAAQKLKAARAEKRRAAAVAAASVSAAMRLPVGLEADPESSAMFRAATQMFTVSVGDASFPSLVALPSGRGVKRPRDGTPSPGSIGSTAGLPDPIGQGSTSSASPPGSAGSTTGSLSGPPKLQRVDSGDGAVSVPRPLDADSSSYTSAPAPWDDDDVDSVTGGPSLLSQMRRMDSTASSASGHPAFGAPPPDATAVFGDLVPDLDDLDGEWLLPLPGSGAPSPASAGDESAGAASTSPLFDLLGKLADDAAAAGIMHDALFTPEFARDLAVADATAMAAGAIASSAGMASRTKAAATALAARARSSALAAVQGAAAASLSTGIASSQLLPFVAGSGPPELGDGSPTESDPALGILTGTGTGAGALVPHEAVRFNRGFFARHAAKSGIDVLALASRVRELLLADDPGALARAARFSTGTLPVRLVEAVSPELQRLLVHHLRASAGVAHALAPTVQRNLAYDFVFDGLHLSTAGLAAVVLAFEDDEDEALAPEGVPILMASTRSVRTAVDGGSSATTPPNASTQRRHHMAQDLVSRAGTNVLPLGLLFARFPHLPRLAAGATPALLKSCTSYLQSLGARVDSVPPEGLLKLYRQHQEAISTPCVRVNFPPHSHVPLSLHMNSAASRLFGITAAAIKRALTSAHPDRSRAVNWGHPSTLLRRVLATVGSANHGLKSFQFEGQYVRSVYKHVPGAREPSITPEYSPFYAVETAHRECFPGGSTSSVNTYFSDVVFTRQVAPVAELQGSTVELDAIEAVMLQGESFPEVRASMRRERTSSVAVALWNNIDYHARRLLMRALSIAFGGKSSPVLRANADFEPEDTPGPRMEIVSTSPLPEGSGGELHTLQPAAVAAPVVEGDPDDPVVALLSSAGLRNLIAAFHAHEANEGQVSMTPPDFHQLAALFSTYEGLAPAQQARVVVALPQAMVDMISTLMGLALPPPELLEAARAAGGTAPPSAGAAPTPPAVGAGAPSPPADLPLDPAEEPEGPAGRIAALQPRLQKAIGGELMRIVSGEVFNHAATQRDGGFMQLHLGKDVLRIDHAPGAVARTMHAPGVGK